MTKFFCKLQRVQPRIVVQEVEGGFATKLAHSAFQVHAEHLGKSSHSLQLAKRAAFGYRKPGEDGIPGLRGEVKAALVFNRRLFHRYRL